MSIRLRRARALVFTALVATAALLVAGCAPGPPPAAQQTAPVTHVDGDSFYVPPVPLPAGTHGDVIWYTPTTAKLYILNTPLAVNAWKILYRSVDALGQPIAVTATVMVPTVSYSGSRPIVSYPGGTKGLGDQCASSKTIPTGGEQESALFSQAIDRGWAVVMTDYEALGTPGTHTYEVGVSEGHATLDAVRAAMRTPGSGLSADAPVGLWGYSQGGGAVAWAGEQAATYTPELKLKGIAGGGIPADLALVAAFGDGGPAFGFVAAAAVGLDAAYPELQLDSYLNANGRSQIGLIKQQCEAEILSSYAGMHMADFVTTNPINTPAWAARLEENKLGKGRPTVPLFLYAGSADTYVPPAGGAALRDAYCAKGVTVRWKQYEGFDHVLTALIATGDAVNWLNDRFTGVAAPTTC